MNIPAKYLHDRLVLLFLSINIFLALAVSIFTILQLSAGHTAVSPVVQCRDCSNVNYVGRFTHGSTTELLSFVVFALLVLVIHTVLSLRTHPIHRQLSVTILALGMLLLIIAGIVSNALLVLR
jgi:hypothetical protein